MSTDAVLIANAIASMKADSNILKDYIFPLAMSFFSAFLGGMSAIYIYSKQERIKKEKENFNKTNAVIVKVVERLNDLVALKINYHNINEVNPICRALLIPPFLSHLQRLHVEVSDFLFIQPIPTANKKWHERFFDFIRFDILSCKRKTLSMDELGRSWRNLSRLSAFVSNYNIIVTTIEERSKKLLEVKSRLSTYSSEYKITISPQLAYDVIGRDGMNALIDLTETFLSMVDHVISEMDSFTKEFSDVAGSNIELSFVGKGVKVIKVLNERELYLACLKPIINPDFNMLAKLFQSTLEEVKYKYTFTEWY